MGHHWSKYHSSQEYCLQSGIAGAVTVRFDNADWSVALHLGLACCFVYILLWQFFAMRKIEVPTGKFSHSRRIQTE